MATESVANYSLDPDLVNDIRFLLLEGIKAASKLELLRANVESAAKSGLPAQTLVSAGMLPGHVEFDVGDAAELVQCLDTFRPKKEA